MGDPGTVGWQARLAILENPQQPPLPGSVTFSLPSSLSKGECIVVQTDRGDFMRVYLSPVLSCPEEAVTIPNSERSWQLRQKGVAADCVCAGTWAPSTRAISYSVS